MKSSFGRIEYPSRFTRFISILLTLVLLVVPLCAQRVTPTAPGRESQRGPEPTFDTLLSADAYQMYGEVRNVGQLLSTGGAGDIVDPIMKLADPPQQFKSILKFLKANSEALSTSRLMFAAWPARTGIPDFFVAVEFSTREDATKFAPKLETFLPTVLPPVEEEKKPEAGKPTGPKPPEQPAMPQSPKPSVAKPAPSPQSSSAHLPFVITHAGNLVCISDKSFKFERLRPTSTKLLSQDQNFRIARDQFTSESIFVFFNIALEDKTKPKPTPTPFVSEAEAARAKLQDTDESEDETPKKSPSPAINEPTVTEEQRAVLTASVSTPSPTPTPTKEEQSQQIASAQIGHMLDAIGYGEPQWPDAIGLAVALDGNEYVIRAILIDPPEARKLPLPFLPQLISGPLLNTEAASVLPDDTDVLVSASIDFGQTVDAMRKQAEIKAKLERLARSASNPNGTNEVAAKETASDPFAEFEKKAGFKIKDDLLPALGNEIALAGSLKSLQMMGGLGIAPPLPSPSPQTEEEKQAQKEKDKQAIPILVVAVRDRETARRLMPRVLDGLGMGEANLIAEVEKREDTEMVNYAGLFAYAFVGDFLVISEAATVRHVIDANLNQKTLSSNTIYRNSRRWQSNKTLGQIYIAPTLMEGYQDEVRRQSANLDPGLRDFLLGLDPNSSAVTYALSNEGLGNLHEIHLPKNLILTTVAGISSATKNPPPEMNEAFAASSLQMIYTSENTYKNAMGKGSYGTLDKLIEEKLVSPETLEKYGYKYEVTVNGDQFEALAMPREYGRTGKRSFFIDKSGVMRAEDHGGGPANACDKPYQP